MSGELGDIVIYHSLYGLDMAAIVTAMMPSGGMRQLRLFPPIGAMQGTDVNVFAQLDTSMNPAWHDSGSWRSK